MQTMNISLPDPMKQYVEEQVAAGAYSSASEYIRELVRADQKRQAKEQLEQTLLDALNSGEAMEATPEWWATCGMKSESGRVPARPLPMWQFQRPRRRSLSSVFVRPRARRDLVDCAAYLENEAGIELADHFVAAARETFEALAYMPRMGKLCGFRRPSLRRVRRWPVKGFENWLAFYQPKRDGIEIVRVIHGSRDIEALLDSKAD